MPLMRTEGESVPYEGTSRWFWRPKSNRLVAFHRGPLDRLVRGPDLDSRQKTLRLRHPPLRQLGLCTELLVLGPPVVSVRVGVPLLDVGFYWYPGRVSWIHTRTYVGWVPHAPRETYHSYRHWGGHHVVVVNNVNITQININVRNYAYAKPCRRGQPEQFLRCEQLHEGPGDQQTLPPSSITTVRRRSSITR